jgi:hypothetical protein
MAQRAENRADVVRLINGGAELDESLDRRLACGPKRGAQVRQAGRPALQSREQGDQLKVRLPTGVHHRGKVRRVEIPADKPQRLNCVKQRRQNQPQILEFVRVHFRVPCCTGNA